MGMPQMGGDEVLRKLRAAGHRVPVAICSGYSEAEVLMQFAGCEFSAFIQKPFKTDELTRRVRALLAVPRGKDGTARAAIAVSMRIPGQGERDSGGNVKNVPGRR